MRATAAFACAFFYSVRFFIQVALNDNLIYGIFDTMKVGYAKQYFFYFEKKGAIY